MGISNNQATIGSATLSAPVSHKRKQLFVLPASTLAFTVCFMAWMMSGVIGIPITKASARALAQLAHEECSRYYALHPELFTSGDLVFARHILIAVTPGAPVGLLRDQAEKVLHEARAHPERFSALATQYSQLPVRPAGWQPGPARAGRLRAGIRASPLRRAAVQVSCRI